MLYAAGHKKYKDIIAVTGKKEFVLQYIFFVGIELNRMLGISFNKDRSVRKINELAIIYGTKDAKKHLILLRGGESTYILSSLIAGLLVSVLGNNPEYVLLGPMLAAVGIVLIERYYKLQILTKKEELIMQFPTMVSKLTLLLGSGMVLRDAWKLTASKGTGVLYDEMKKTVDEMNNGVFELLAYKHFADRCQIKEIRRFSANICQNVQKGSAELVNYLEDMAVDVWKLKQEEVKKKGVRAGELILLPSALIFIGILIMIMAPVLAGFSF